MSNLKKFGWWLVSQIIPTTLIMGGGFAIGFHRGHDAGRTEMKCAFLAITERLAEKPFSGGIVLDCPKQKP